MSKRLTSLKVIKIGNSAGVILPADLMARLGLKLGDTLDLSEVSDGVIVTGQAPDGEREMRVAREVMTRRHEALGQLSRQ